MRNLQSRLLILTASALCTAFTVGTASAQSGGYYDDRDGYYSDRDYDRDRGYGDRDAAWEQEEERRQLALERERLELERRALNSERSQPEAAARPSEQCPSGFSPSENKCSPQERKQGCKDIRLPGGLGCVKR